MNLEAYRRELTGFLRTRAEQHHLAAIEPTVDQSSESIEQQGVELFGRDVVRELANLSRAVGPNSGVCWLAEIAIAEFMRLRSQRQEAEARQHLAALELEFSGGRTTWNGLMARLAATEDPRLRRQIAATLEPLTESLRPRCRRVFETRRAAYDEIGSWPLWERWGYCRDRDFGSVVRLAAGLLDATEERYREALEVNIELADTVGELVFADLLRYLTHPLLDGFVPDCAEGLFEYIGRCLGFSDSMVARVQLHAVSSSTRHDGPSVFVVDVPDRIHGGLPSQQPGASFISTLRLFGLAMPFAACRGDVAVEFQRSGDPALRALFGALFEAQVASATWMSHTLGRELPAALVQSLRLRRLLTARRQAAWVLLAEEDQEAESAVQLSTVDTAAALSAATAFEYPAALLPDGPSLSVAADELLGCLSAVAVDDLLRLRYGHLWLGKEAAGLLLRALWEEGTIVGLQGTLTALDLDPPAVDPLLDRWLSVTKS